MLIGSNSNFFQQLSTASTAVATPTAPNAAPTATTTSPEKFTGQQKSSLAQAESGKGAGFLGRVSDFIGALDGGGPSKRDIKKAAEIRSELQVNQVPNRHQSLAADFVQFARTNNDCLIRSKAGLNLPGNITEKEKAAFSQSREIPQEVITFIEKNPAFLTEFIVNPGLGRGDLLQHNFAPNGQSNPPGTAPTYDQLRKYSTVFPTDATLEVFKDWLGQKFRAESSSPQGPPNGPLLNNLNNETLLRTLTPFPQALESALPTQK